jgi:small subunit ribosomal protein S9
MTQTQSWSKGTGRRKSSIARVQLTNGTGKMQINQFSDGKYMQDNDYLIQKIQAPLAYLQLDQQVDIIVNVNGGGRVGQANAIQLGIARALCNFKPEYRPSLKLKGFLTRDARVKERKKYGLKKARKAPQYSKR